MDKIDYHQLASRWAPINYQYINQSNCVNNFLKKMDIIVRVKMDCYQSRKDTEKCWKTKNMKASLEETKIEDLTPIAYYSVAQTQNHLYLLYSFFHAYDTPHPNDMEGCLVILERNETGNELLGMITTAHHKTPAYSYDNRLRLKDGCPAEKLLVEEEGDELHPLIQQESGKHGMYALGEDTPTEIKIWRTFKIVFGQYQDKMVYYYGVAKKYDPVYLKRYKNTPHYPSFYYDLVYIHDKKDGLYHRKKTQPNSTFDSDGKFYGGAANPPWLWEGNGISLWDNPAGLADSIFKSDRKPFDVEYEVRMDKDVVYE